MDKMKVAAVSVFAWGAVVSVYVIVWPDLPVIDGFFIALFIAGIVGMFYAKGE